MSEKFFLDTNIFLYSFDRDSKQKRVKASRLISEALSTGLGVISHQVIQEFVSVADSKFKNSFSPQKLVLYFEEVLFYLWKSYPDRELFVSAIQIRDKYKLSWWDSLIVAAALATGCRKLYTEDLQHQMEIYTLEVINPFV